MAETQIKLKGWHAIVGIVLVIGIAGARFLTLRDVKDPVLMRKLKSEIMTDYFPNDVEKLKSAVKARDREATSKTVKSIATSKITIESAQVSAPLLSFSTSQEVVVKVIYSVDDASGNRDKGTKYYRFKRGAMTKSWSYQYETTALSYYLNFK